MKTTRSGAGVRILPDQALLLVNAAHFAMQPETMPVFRAWLERETPPDTIPPADQIPHDLAEAALMLTACVVHQEACADRARAAGAHVP